MPWLTLIFSIVTSAYGAYMLYLRARRPETLGRLAKMKETCGEFQGNIMHLVFYALFPLGVGVLLFIQWYAGIASL